MRFGAVVPAAGLSRRMGREKVLLPFGSSTMLETVLSKLSTAGVARIRVARSRSRLRRASRIESDEMSKQVTKTAVRLALTVAIAAARGGCFVSKVDPQKPELPLPDSLPAQAAQTTPLPNP